MLLLLLLHSANQEQVITTITRTLPDQSYRTIIRHVNIHVLSERTRKDRDLLALNAALIAHLKEISRKFLKKLLVELTGRVSRHGAMEVWFGALEVVVESDQYGFHDLAKASTSTIEKTISTTQRKIPTLKVQEILPAMGSFR